MKRHLFSAALAVCAGLAAAITAHAVPAQSTSWYTTALVGDDAWVYTLQAHPDSPQRYDALYRTPTASSPGGSGHGENIATVPQHATVARGSGAAMVQRDLTSWYHLTMKDGARTVWEHAAPHGVATQVLPTPTGWVAVRFGGPESRLITVWSCDAVTSACQQQRSDVLLTAPVTPPQDFQVGLGADTLYIGEQIQATVGGSTMTGPLALSLQGTTPPQSLSFNATAYGDIEATGHSSRFAVSPHRVAYACTARNDRPAPPAEEPPRPTATPRPSASMDTPATYLHHGVCLHTFGSSSVAFLADDATWKFLHDLAITRDGVCGIYMNRYEVRCAHEAAAHPSYAAFNDVLPWKAGQFVQDGAAIRVLEHVRNGEDARRWYRIDTTKHVTVGGYVYPATELGPR